jgi:hypothetical protein
MLELKQGMTAIQVNRHEDLPDAIRMLSCDDFNGRERYTKALAFKDFPEPGIRFCQTDWYTVNPPSGTFCRRH